MDTYNRVVIAGMRVEGGWRQKSIWGGEMVMGKYNKSK